MAKRRVNKNLVAFLTISGVFLSVVLVVVVTMNASRRDPVKIAETAVMREESGNLREALRLYKQAFNKSKDPVYLVEGARVAFERGDPSESLQLLNRAFAEQPSNPTVLTALLDRYWAMQRFGFFTDQVGEYAEAMLRVDDENLTAIAMQAQVLLRRAMAEPQYQEDADELLERGLEIDPTNSRIVAVVASRDLRAAELAARDPSLSSDEREALLADARKDVAARLEQALAAHPEDAQLRMRLADLYRIDGQPDRAIDTLRAGIGETEDDDDLKLAVAEQIQRQLSAEFEDLSEEVVTARVDEAIELIDEALEAEPALYAGYTTRAVLQQLRWVKSGEWETNTLARQKELLEGLEQALQNTIGLQTIRALLGEGARLQLITSGFDLANTFFNRADDERVREQALTFMRRFHQEAQTAFPDRPQVSLLEGYLALAENDAARAVQAFEQADRAAENPGVSRLAKERLAQLHRSRQQPGLALRYLDEALAQYEAANRNPPVSLLLMRVDLLVSTNRAQEAADLLNRLEPALPEGAEIAPVKARVLSALGMESSARELIDAAGEGERPSALLMSARVAASAGDFDAAITSAKRLIELEPNSQEGWPLMLQLFERTERRDEGLEFVRAQRSDVTDETLLRQLGMYELILAYPEQEDRDREILAYIEDNPDEEQRAQELFTYYWQREQYEDARAPLNTLLRVRGEDERTLRQQLELLLRLEECEQAGQVASKLAQMDADRAGGATFRARVAFSCGDMDTALGEYRAAERAFPSDSGIKTRIGQILMAAEPPQYQEALDALTAAVEIAPTNFLSRKLLYICYEQLGRRDEGLRHLAEAAKLNPNDEFVRSRSQLLAEEQDPAAGIAAREQIRADEPENVDNLLRLAELYNRVEDRINAQRTLQEAADVAPEDFRVAALATQLFARTDQERAGEEIIRKHIAAQEGRERVRAEVVLARYFEMTGDFAAAEAQLKQAQTNAAENPVPTDDGEAAIDVLLARELADFYSRLRSHEQAAAAFRTLRGLVSDDQTELRQAAELGLTAALINLGELDQAEATIATFRESFPNDVRGLRVAAELRMQRDDTAGAREVLEQILQQAPNDQWALWMRGRLLLNDRRFGAAREDLARVKQLNPSAFNLGPRFDLVRVYVLTEEYERAEAELREILKLPRASADAELRLISLLKRIDRLQEAQQFVNELIVREPQNAQWRIQLADILQNREQYSAAADALRMGIDRLKAPDPNMVANWLMLLNLAGRMQEVAQLYERYRPEQRVPTIKAAAAGAMDRLGRTDEARSLAYEASQNAFARENFGLANRTLQLLEQAVGPEMMLDQAQAAMQSLRDDSTAKMMARLLVAAQLVGETDTAAREAGVDLVDQVLAKLEADSDYWTFALSVKATGLGELGRTEEAVAAYEAVLERSPDNVQMLNNLAFLLADKLDKAAQAVPYAERARVLDDDNPMVLDTLGWTYFLNGELAKAEAVLVDASRLAPNNLPIRYHLGRVYAATQRTQEARAAFQRVLNLSDDTNNEYVRRAEQALREL